MYGMLEKYCRRSKSVRFFAEKNNNANERERVVSERASEACAFVIAQREASMVEADKKRSYNAGCGCGRGRMEFVVGRRIKRGRWVKYQWSFDHECVWTFRWLAMIRAARGISWKLAGKGKASEGQLSLWRGK